jgi:hypothetical protein
MTPAFQLFLGSWLVVLALGAGVWIGGWGFLCGFVFCVVCLIGLAGWTFGWSNK